MSFHTASQQQLINAPNKHAEKLEVGNFLLNHWEVSMCQCISAVMIVNNVESASMNGKCTDMHNREQV